MANEQPVSLLEDFLTDILEMKFYLPLSINDCIIVNDMSPSVLYSNKIEAAINTVDEQGSNQV